MARSIDSVTTFVAEISGLPLSEILEEKFEGRRTPRTLAAARRIASKKRKVKVPRNLLRQLWRITGGWKPGTIKSGWDGYEPDQNDLVVELGGGRLQVVFDLRRDLSAYLIFDGAEVARFDTSGYRRGWNETAKAKRAAKALGQPWPETRERDLDPFL